MEDNRTDAEDQKVFRHLWDKSAGTDEIKTSFKTLMRMMYAIYGRQVILLIDEYDVPLAKANANGYYIEMLDMIRH